MQDRSDNFFVRKKLYFMDWWLALEEVYFCYRLSHACHAHSVLFLPMHSLLKGFRLSHACHAHSVLFLPMHSLLKGFRRSHACHAHCVLFLPICTVCSKVSDSLMLAMRILFCSCQCKVCSRVSDALSQALCSLSLAFLVDFTVSDSTALIRFTTFSQITLRFSFGSKDMITAFTCPSSYRYSSFTLRAYLLLEAYLLPMDNRTRKVQRTSPQERKGR